MLFQKFSVLQLKNFLYLSFSIVDYILRVINLAKLWKTQPISTTFPTPLDVEFG